MDTALNIGHVSFGQLHYPGVGQNPGVGVTVKTLQTVRTCEDYLDAEYRQQFSYAKSRQFTIPSPKKAVMAFAMQTQMRSLSFKSNTADSRHFLAPQPATLVRGQKMAVVLKARGPSLKPKTNIAKVPYISHFLSAIACIIGRFIHCFYYIFEQKVAQLACIHTSCTYISGI